MPEGRVAQWPLRAWPAVGGGGRFPRKVLVRRAAVVLGLILILGLAKYVVAGKETGVGLDSLSSLLGGRAAAGDLYFGGEPLDRDLQSLAGSYGVNGVVNLSGPNVAEQATVNALHLAYMRLPLALGDAPTWEQLHMLASFIYSHTPQGHAIYLSDDFHVVSEGEVTEHVVGGGRAVVTADMLLLLRGTSWPAVFQWMTPEERLSLSDGQWRSLIQLASALHSGHHPSRSNPYADARFIKW